GAVVRFGTTRFRSGTPIRCGAFSPDGTKLATGSADGVVSLWEFNSGRLLHPLASHPKEDILCLAFSPEGTLLASGATDPTTRLARPPTPRRPGGRGRREGTARPKGARERGARLGLQPGREAPRHRR